MTGLRLSHTNYIAESDDASEGGRYAAGKRLASHLP